jgi:tRNA-splicing ligase RtcB
MSRGEAKRRSSLQAHAAATSGIECLKDAGLIDETPMALEGHRCRHGRQTHLVEVVHTLRQVVCIKG